MSALKVELLDSVAVALHLAQILRGKRTIQSFDARVKKKKNERKKKMRGPRLPLYGNGIGYVSQQ
jgi:hypothetical protein